MSQPDWPVIADGYIDRWAEPCTESAPYTTLLNSKLLVGHKEPIEKPIQEIRKGAPGIAVGNAPSGCNETGDTLNLGQGGTDDTDGIVRVWSPEQTDIVFRHQNRRKAPKMKLKFPAYFRCMCGSRPCPGTAGQEKIHITTAEKAAFI